MKKIILVFLVLTFNISIAQTGWFWQNPKPQGTNLNDACMLNSSTFLAIGDGGTLVKSTDSGASWTVKNIYPVSDTKRYRLLSIYPYGEFNLNIVASVKNINSSYTTYNFLKSIDGGETWSSYFVDSSTYPTTLKKLRFSDSNTGWIFSNSTEPSFDYRTTNGGINWARYSINGNDTLGNIFFLNQNTGWIQKSTGSTFFKTTNAGTSWTSYTAPIEFITPFFLNENTGWINGGKYKTTNGGINFFPNNTETTDYVKECYFINESTGWCVYYSAGIYRTTNSGVNWLPAHSGNFTSVISSAGNTWYSVGQAGEMIKSTDYGASWNSLSFSLFKNDFYSSVFFINENTGWIAGERCLMKTSNGGNNWIKKDTISTYENIKFINENTGIFTSGSVYGVTTNGGANWITDHYAGYTFSNINIPGSTVWYINAFNYQTGLNVILKTTNSGINWPVASSAAGAVYTMHFINTTTGFFSGVNGTFKTINGGSSWQNISPQIFKQVFFTDDNNGCAAGYNGLYKTTNSGANWTEVYYNINTFMQNIYFANSLTGYASIGDGGYGMIMKTTDAGSTWKSNSNIVTNVLLSVQFINPNTGWAVGFDGNIIKTITGGTVGVQQISTSLPDKFYLEQNYPNPFNPNTNIEFSLPQKSFVRLKVFDLLGREVANLVNENLSAGSYKYDFNASALTSGIYFYKLETENFSETKKMVLVK